MERSHGVAPCSHLSEQARPLDGPHWVLDIRGAAAFQGRRARRDEERAKGNRGRRHRERRLGQMIAEQNATVGRRGAKSRRCTTCE